MKALSIHPLFAGWIFGEKKTVEIRTWSTTYRGDLLICSTAKKYHGTIPGHALCVVTLADIVPLQKKHMEAACLHESDWEPGLYAWIFKDVRPIKPIALKGRLGLWNYDGPIEYLEPPETEEDDEKQYNLYYRDIFI